MNTVEWTVWTGRTAGRMNYRSSPRTGLDCPSSTNPRGFKRTCTGDRTELIYILQTRQKNKI